MNKKLVLWALSEKYPGLDKLHLEFAKKKLTGINTKGETVNFDEPSFDFKPIFDLYEFEFIVSITVFFTTNQIKIVGDKTILI